MSGAKEIDWGYWLALPSVKVWESIALSLNIDPTDMGHRDEGLQSGLFFGEHAFPSRSVKEEFKRRLRLLATSLSNSTKSSINPSFHSVQLRDVAAWLNGLGRKPIAAGMLRTADFPIKDVLTSLLAELAEPNTHGWLKNDADREGIRAGLVRAVDENQLLALIRDIARAGQISPIAPPGSTSTELRNDWTITAAQRKILRAALAQRIEERTRTIEVRLKASSESDCTKLAEKLAAGRYTLAEAAKMAGDDSKRLLQAFRIAAQSMTLPVYNFGRKQRLARDQVRPVSPLVEAYWNDLNKWLDENEPRIEFRFPEPVAEKSPKPQASKSQDEQSAGHAAVSALQPSNVKVRRNSLDPSVEAAIERAGTLGTSAVFEQLRELALVSTPPFAGTIRKDGALEYTNAKNMKVALTKKALADRLRRRALPLDKAR